MNHYYHKPKKEVAGFIRTILVMDGTSETNSTELPIFTNGMPALLCKMETDNSELESVKLLCLCGKIPESSWNITESTTLIIYFFKPFTAASIFNVPIKKMTDGVLNLSIWNPHKYNALRAQLIYAKDIKRKLEVLDNLLIQEHTENKQALEIIQTATDQILHSSNKEVLSELIRALKINERTLQRLFKKYVGVTPTQYRRICQFQKSFGQMREMDFDKMTEVAFDNGFTDQSHFIRTFKEFTEVTPKEYIKQGLKKK